MKIGSGSGGNSPEYAAQRVSEGYIPTVASEAPVKAVAVIGSTKPERLVKSDNPEQQLEFSEEFMKKSVDQANRALAQHSRLIQREVHDVTHTVMYTIRDTVTNEIIAEYPPKKIQDMIAKMWELAGLFVDERA